MSGSVISLTDKRTLQFSKEFPPNRNQPPPPTRPSWFLVTLPVANEASGQKCEAAQWQLCWSRPFLSHLVLWGKRKCIVLIKWWILERDWLSVKPLEEQAGVCMCMYVHVAFFVYVCVREKKEGALQMWRKTTTFYKISFFRRTNIFSEKFFQCEKEKNRTSLYKTSQKCNSNASLQLTTAFFYSLGTSKFFISKSEWNS